MQFEHLFQPIKIGNLDIRNRIVMGPTATHFENEDGSFTQQGIDHYAARSKGGAGIIIIGCVTVDTRARYFCSSPGAWDDKYIENWKKMADAIHEGGAKLFPQLMHPGPIDPRPGICVNASRVPVPTLEPDVWGDPHELTVPEIEQIIDDFGEAALRCKKAGCDGVEFHMAHGAYALTASFVSPILNKRTDEYGGTIEGRMKFPLECIKAIKAKAGDDFPIIIRLSGDELDPYSRTLQETCYVVHMLEKAGVAAIHVSGGSCPAGGWRVTPVNGLPMAINADYAEVIKKNTSLPVMVVGNIRTPGLADYLIEKGTCDMVVCARSFIADPEWPNKAMEGRLDDIMTCCGCVGCNVLLNTGHSIGCTINTDCGKTAEETALIPAETPKKVLIIGGGPAGMEAARVARLRGHEVTLVEKAEKLGGQLNIAAVSPAKQSLTLITQYFSHQLDKLGVTVQLGTEATPEWIAEQKPDAVILATGATPIVPASIPGINKDNVVTAWDILSSEKKPGYNVVVVGGGAIGCEVAEYLAGRFTRPYTKGRITASLVEMQDSLAKGLDYGTTAHHADLIGELGIDVHLNSKVKEITDDGLVIETNGVEERITGKDQVILAMGSKPYNPLESKLREIVPEVYVIGDAETARTAMEATHTGAKVGRLV
ncbi:MAG: FAD-dependent oxidoreductase [Eubacteriales bacterium]|nr:FAD-dependent oxidoreductase [Eubacteriales bacterium]